MGKVILSIILLSFLVFKNYDYLLKNESQIVDLKSLNHNRKFTKLRSPASAPESMRFQNQLIFLDVGCSEGRNSNKEHQVHSEYVQLTGRTCLKMTESEEVSIKNISNDSDGLYFLKSTDSYSTDLIYLKMGKNEIAFKSQSNPQIQTLVISRIQ